MRQLYKQELAINIVKGEDGGRIFDGAEGLTGIKNLFRYQEGSFFQEIKEKFGLDSNRPAVSSTSSNSNSSSSNNVARNRPVEPDTTNERENRKQRLSATNEWLRNNSINQQMVEKAIANSDVDTFHFLQSIGIDPKNVHQNEEMLKARYDDDDDDAIASKLGVDSSILNYFDRIPATSTDTRNVTMEVTRVDSPVIPVVEAVTLPVPTATFHITSHRNGIPGLNIRGYTQETKTISPSVTVPTVKLHRPSYIENDK